MTQQNIISSTEFYSNGNLPFTGLMQEDSYETSFCWKNKISNGKLHTYQLRQGLVLNVVQLTAHETMSIPYEVRSACINLSSFLVGNAYCRPDMGNAGESYFYTPASAHIHAIPKHQGSGTFPAGARIAMIQLYISPDLFSDFLAEQASSVSPFAKNLAGNPTDNYIAQPVFFTPEMQYVNQQILTCPFHGPLKRVYLEGKALEMTALYTNAAQMAEKSINKGPMPMRPHEAERIRHAAELMRNNMQDPPTLVELAQAVGLSHSKLNRFFPQLYGTTVFHYLRDLRMHHARMLLNNGNMNVTEAAISVGYSNLSHFAGAFRDKFGLLPSQYLRQILGNKSLK